MRVLLLAVTAAVMGTLLLEHMRLQALSTPQRVVTQQPMRQEASASHAANDALKVEARASSSTAHMQQGNPAVQQAVGSQQEAPQDGLHELLPKKR